MITNFFILFLLSLLTVILPLIQKELLSSIEVRQELNKWIIVLLLTGIIYSILRYILEIRKEKINRRLERDLQSKLIINGIEKTNKLIENRGAGSYLMSVYGDVEQLTGIISNQEIESACLSLLQLLAILIISLFWSPWLALTILLGYAVGLLSTIHYRKVYKEEFSLFRKILMEINPKILELLENRSSVLSYLGLDRANKKINTLFEERDLHVQNAGIASKTSDSVINFISFFTQLAFITISAIQLGSGKLDFPTLTALLSYIALAFTPISKIKSSLDTLNRLEVLQSRIEPFLTNETKNCVPEGRTLSFKDCILTYETEEGKQVSLIDQLSHTFKGLTGIVGLSGSGKTTLVKALLGTVAPNRGSVNFGGCPISEINQSFLYSSFKLYPQNPEIYNDSLLYNITFNKQALSEAEFLEKKATIHNQLIQLTADNIHENPGLAELVATLLGQAKSEPGDLPTGPLDKFLERLTSESTVDNLATQAVNREYFIQERYLSIIDALELTKLDGRDLGFHGEKISGGEKNKIALARLLLPYGDYFTILDEPFTNMDIFSVKHCLAAYQRFNGDAPGIIISHNLFLISQLCDEILVVENNDRVAIGSHQQLLSDNHLYKDLYEEHIKSQQEHDSQK
ncbi:MAG: ABC transporter ATP-binding protein [Anaerolineaceae bacterium]|nr:ABC transporter ATP-binding protein [Anaerolineaceae bacterium]